MNRTVTSASHSHIVLVADGVKHSNEAEAGPASPLWRVIRANIPFESITSDDTSGEYILEGS